MSLPLAILVGGLANRLRPLTEDIPKALVPINGRPFLAFQLELLYAAGIRDVVICAWYRAEQIEAFAGEGERFGLRIQYSIDGEHSLGTGGAIRKARSLLGDAFFVLYGDSYLPIDYSAVERAFANSGKDALMTVYRNRNRGGRSNVRFENGVILAYDKLNLTPDMQHIDFGLGVFKSQAFEPYPPDAAFDLAKVYQVLLMEKSLAAYEVARRFYEIGSFEGIQELEEYLKENRET